MRALGVALGIVIVLFLLSCAGFFFPIEGALYLLFGWAFYLYRVLPKVTIAPDGVALATICLAGFAWGGHAFLSWLRRESGGPPWRPRWTAAIVGLVVLMFVAGLSAGGVAHQVGWLVGSGEKVLDVSGSARATSLRIQSTNNLKQIALALANYHDEYGAFPPGGTFDSSGRGVSGWAAALLPDLEQQAIASRINPEVPWDDPRNVEAYRARLGGVFHNPAIRELVADASGRVHAHYAGNAYLLGGDRPRRWSEITDGTSNTLIVGDAMPPYQPWGSPSNWRDPALGLNRHPRGFGGPHPGGVNFAFSDGSVRFLKNSIDPKVLKALATPDGGETIDPGSY